MEDDIKYQLTENQMKDLIRGIADDVTKQVVSGMTAQPYRLLSVKNIAKEFGFAENTVRAWINRGILTYVKIDGKRVVAETDLKEFFERNKIQAVCQAL